MLATGGRTSSWPVARPAVSTPVIVRDVLRGRGRLDSRRESLGISEAVLARRLRSMVDAGLLERVDYRDGGRTRQGVHRGPSSCGTAPDPPAAGDLGRAPHGCARGW
ncbi:hypothetical protein LP422_18080 [Janibacter limosus]|uniref:Uncharacterized protein n=1 Tax=Janibacter limosus TaxID=53458 RepID=A0AC61U2V7_9MICO|nr:hypothetical protein [Janibacter limosus]UUZ44340.1 hypothetical protein LP422_18080 [Janibacter limosus]